MAALSTTHFGQEWLKNFDPEDKTIASTLLDSLVLVSASEFMRGITKQLTTIVKKAQEGKYKVALYAEREITKVNREVQSFFPNTQKGRATGSGIQPVVVDTDKQDIGSEGIVAALVSKFCKSYPKFAFSHPGPDLLREKKIRKIIIVTDFIGSGGRVHDMLDSFEKVATLQSWKSYQLLKFGVICYSCTEWGLQTVKGHSLRPEAFFHVACPILDEVFEGSDLGAIKLLCKKYPKKKTRFPFGFSDTGSLIVFSHGIPNNAPWLLHSSDAGWKPLFEGRSTIISDLDSIADTSEVLIKNSQKVLGIRNARKLLNDKKGKLWVEAMLVLSVIKKGISTPSKLSAYTQLPVSSIEEIIKTLSHAGWLTAKNTLTVLGRRELRWVERFHSLPDVLAYPPNELYFPKQLRAP